MHAYTNGTLVLEPFVGCGIEPEDDMAIFYPPHLTDDPCVWNMGDTFSMGQVQTQYFIGKIIHSEHFTQGTLKYAAFVLMIEAGGRRIPVAWEDCFEFVHGLPIGQTVEYREDCIQGRSFAFMAPDVAANQLFRPGGGESDGFAGFADN